MNLSRRGGVRKGEEGMRGGDEEKETRREREEEGEEKGRENKVEELQYITVYYSIPQYTTVYHSIPQYITVYHSIFHMHRSWIFPPVLKGRTV